ncbi:MAG: hypothetical protein HUJ60_02965 [Bacilli bacterium]|nr:hypothetical protein [Bacilli bacterium]
MRLRSITFLPLAIVPFVTVSCPMEIEGFVHVDRGDDHFYLTLSEKATGKEEAVFHLSPLTGVRMTCEYTSGSLRVRVFKGEDEPIYEGNERGLAEIEEKGFIIVPPTSADYTISVTFDEADANIGFKVLDVVPEK